MPDPIQSYLTGVQLPQESKAQLWDHFNASTDENDLAQRLQKFNAPDDVKARLWDMKVSTKAPPMLSPAGAERRTNSQYLGNSTKPATIGPPKRTWDEDLYGSLPAIPGAMLGASEGAAAGTAILPGFGTAVGGFLGGVAGAYGGNFLGDMTIANPMSNQRREIPTPPIKTSIKEAHVAGKRGAIAEAIAGPVSAGLGKIVEAIPTPEITTQGQRVIDRFSTPGVTKSSVLPSEVTESRALLGLENAGRSSMFGGGAFDEADKVANTAVRREANKELTASWARPLPESATAAQRSVNRLSPYTGSKVQSQIITNRAAAEKTGNEMFEKVWQQADESGIGLTRDSGATAAASDELKEPLSELGRMRKVGGTVKSVFDTEADEPLREGINSEIASKRMQIAGTAADKIPSLEEYITKQPVQETLNLKQLHEEASEAGRAYKMLKESALARPENKVLAAQAKKEYLSKMDQLQGALADHPEVADAYKAARQNWAQLRQTYDNKAVTKIANMTPDNIVKTLMSGTLPGTREGATRVMLNRRQLVNRVLKAAPEVQDMVRGTTATKLVTSAMDPKSGTILGQALKEDLIKNSETLRPLLGERYRAWTDFADLLAYKQRKREDIGRLFFQLRQPQAIAETAAGKPGVARSAILAVPAVLSRIMTNPGMLKALQDGWSLGPKTAVGARALSQLGTWLATENTDHSALDEIENEDKIPEPPK